MNDLNTWLITAVIVLGALLIFVAIGYWSRGVDNVLLTDDLRLSTDALLYVSEERDEARREVEMVVAANRALKSELDHEREANREHEVELSNGYEAKLAVALAERDDRKADAQASLKTIQELRGQVEELAGALAKSNVALLEGARSKVMDMERMVAEMNGRKSLSPAVSCGPTHHHACACRERAFIEMLAIAQKTVVVHASSLDLMEWQRRMRELIGVTDPRLLG